MKEIKTEIDHVYITSDNKKFLSREEALIKEAEIAINKVNKVEETKMNVNIYNLFIKLLASNDWGLYYKNEPLQALPVHDGHKMFKINDVDINMLHEALMKEIAKEGNVDKWENSNSSQDLENSTES